MTAGAALLIGNTDYRGPFPRLRTPLSDIENLGDRFHDLGFQTFIVPNANRQVLGSCIAQFRDVLEALPPGANAFVYFAGHGIQRGGENYLVPIDAAGQNQNEVLWSCFRLSELMGALCWREDQQKLIAIDACRTNQLPSDTRSGAVGLAGESTRRYEAVRETEILYATEPDHVAQDGAAYGSSPFCRGLLDALKQPHRSVRELSVHVTDFVCDAMQDMQRPWASGTVRRNRPFVLPHQGTGVGDDVPGPHLPSGGLRSIIEPSDSFVAQNGHLVHKLKAKDTTGQWAYYFVLVEPRNEAAFLTAIEGSGVLDLEAYGYVIASSYGEFPPESTRTYLKDRYGFEV